MRRLKEMAMYAYTWQYDDALANNNCTQDTPETSAVFVLQFCPPKTLKGVTCPWESGRKPYDPDSGWNWVDGKCMTVKDKGAYTSLFQCEKANMKYKCTTVKMGDGKLEHDYCMPSASGTQTYEECYNSCY